MAHELANHRLGPLWLMKAIKRPYVPQMSFGGCWLRYFGAEVPHFSDALIACAPKFAQIWCVRINSFVVKRPLCSG